MKEKKRHKMQVLIVDDSKLVCDRLVVMISDIPGLEIAGQATNANDAIDSIKKHKPEVVVLDIRMPGGNGFDVLKKINKYKLDPLVIMLTNYPFPQYRKKCMDAGADFFFDKSTEFYSVIEVLKKLAQEFKAHGDMEKAKEAIGNKK